MNFGEAIEALKHGRGVRRAGWNGKGMWLRLVGWKDAAERHEAGATVGGGIGEIKGLRRYIEMKDAEGWLVPWLASQTDMLADDWELLL